MQYVNRNLNERTENRTGVKIGDFGTGGRVYHNTVRVERGSEAWRFGAGGGCGKGVVLVLALGALVGSEYHLAGTLSMLSVVADETVFLNDTLAHPSLDGKLVGVAAYGPKVELPNGDSDHTGALRDDFFGYTFIGPNGAAVQAKRVPEYCQWQEIRHVDRNKVGQEPDYCTSTGAEGCNVNCGGRSANSCGGTNQNGQACCRVQRGADIYEESIYFTYHKGWRDNRINSLLFDNPVAYNNPSRDPAPSWSGAVRSPVHLGTATSPSSLPAPPPPQLSLWVRFVKWIRSILQMLGLVSKGPGNSAGEEIECGPRHACEELRTEAYNVEKALEPWRRIMLGPSIGSGLSGGALDSGFGEYDHQYFYSRVAENGMLMNVGKVGAAYLLDGVVDINTIAKGTGLEGLLGRAGLDWITKGTCNAGDVRVHLEHRDLPTSLTVVAEQRGNGYLVSHAYPNGRVAFLARSGILTLEAFVQAESTDASSTAFWVRCLVLVLAMAAFYTGGVGSPEANAAASGWSIFLFTFKGLAVVCAACTLLWAYAYGLEDGVPPLLLAGGALLASNTAATASAPARKEKSL